MKRKRWIKLFCYEWLHKPYIRSLKPEQRLVWISLEALAGDQLKGNGMIGLSEKIGYTPEQLADLLAVDIKLLKNTLYLLREKGVVKDGEKGVIYMTDFKDFQSEYLRQKPYRNKQKSEKLQSKVTGLGYKNYSTSTSTSISSISSTKEYNNYRIKWNDMVKELKDNNNKVTLQVCNKLTRERIKHLKARLSEKEFDFDKILKHIRNSDFLQGLKNGKGHENFKVSFDWILKENNYIKILEGKYDNKKSIPVIKKLGF